MPYGSEPESTPFVERVWMFVTPRYWKEIVSFRVLNWLLT